MQKPKISEITKAHIQQMRSAKIEPSDEEIIWLYQLGEIVDNPQADDSRLLFNKPLRVNGLRFYLLAIGAKMWLSECAFEWWGDGETMQGAAVLYASANANNQDAFEWNNKEKAKWKIIAWAFKARILLRDKDIDKIYNYILQDEQYGKGKESEKKQSIIPVIGLLNKYFPGHDDNYWLWEIPDELCNRKLETALKAEGKNYAGLFKTDRGNNAFFEMNRIVRERIDGT